MKKINSKIYTIQKDYVSAHFQTINVQPEENFYNNQCHRNAREYARRNKGTLIALVFLADEEQVILHCINCSKGKYLETTLGSECENWDYYLVKYCSSNSVCNDFNAMRSFMKRILPWYLRKFKFAIV